MSTACVETVLKRAVYDSAKRMLTEEGRFNDETDKQIYDRVMNLELKDVVPYFGQFTKSGVLVGIVVEERAKEIAGKVV